MPQPMQFVNPVCLYFLLAALIPVLVHLFDWQRYKKIYFSNVRMLQQIEERQRRKARLREYAVLASRVLTVVCLVLAFAEPYIPEHADKSAGRGQTRVSIYLDNSFSMQAPTERSLLLEQAKDEVKNILKAFPPDASVQLLTNEFHGEDQAFHTADKILEKLPQIESSSASRTLAEVLTRQQSLFEQSGIPSASRLYYLVSDFQKVNFRESIKPDTASRYVLVPLKASNYANLSVDSLCLDMPVLQAGRETPLRVFLQNRSDKEQLQLPLRLFVQGKQRGAYPVDLKAGEKKEVVIPLPLEQIGNLQAFVEIPDYPMRFDDRLYFSLQVASKIKVFHLFEEVPSSAVAKVFAQDSNFEYRAMSPKNIDYGSLRTAALIVADALQEWPSALAGELEQFVRDGGSLLLIPCAPPAGNENFVPDEAVCRALIGAVRAPFVAEEMPVKQVEVNHPVFSLAFSSPGKNADYPKTWGHYPLPTAARVPYRSLMSFSTGNHMAQDADFLQVYSAGSGRLYLLSSPLQKKYTDFDRHYTFVVALLNMALYQGGSGALYHETGGNQGLYFPSALLAQSSEEGLFHLVSTDDPDFDLIPSVRRIGSETAFFLYDARLEAGNYLLTDFQKIKLPISFNHPRAESEKECMDEDDLRNRLQDLRLKKAFVMNPDKTDLSKSVERMERGRELWKVFLIFALAFALFEMLFLRGLSLKIGSRKLR